MQKKINRRFNFVASSSKITTMETEKNYTLVPGYGNAFSTGWRVMTDNFLRLLLVIIILSILTAPLRMMNFKFDSGDLHHFSQMFGRDFYDNLPGIFAIGSLGILAAFFTLLAFLYGLLVAPVFKYGGNMIFLQSVRRIKPDFEYLIKGFMENYFPIILAHLMVIALVILGFFLLIIPGIIVACRLSFVPYIVMDKKLDPIDAVELSWRLTKGHGWKIFFMGLTSFFIIIFGLILLIVGVFPALMWITASFASLYESVLREKEPVIPVTA
jgi:uncharacterized membrane protein